MSFIKVAKWRGYGVAPNPFTAFMLKGLKAAECRVTSLNDIDPFRTGDADTQLIHWPERAFSEARRGPQMVQKPLALIAALADRPAPGAQPRARRRIGAVLWTLLRGPFQRPET